MTLVWSALSIGAVYALVAIGYNIVYISSRTFNFAQASLMMLGVFIAYSGLISWGLATIWVLLIAVAVVAVAAAVEQLVAVRPVKDMHNVLVTTIGASMAIDGFVQLKWGSQPLTVPFFGGNDAINFLGGRVYPIQPVLIALAILVVLGLGVFSKYSLVGLALRGISEDREAAQLRGVNVRAMAFVAFVAAGVLAGFVAIFVGPQTFAVSTLGSELALKGFVVLAIGGFGSMPGTLVGGAIVGLVEALSTRYLGSEYANLSVFVILVVVLMTRPAGLFVRATERAV